MALFRRGRPGQTKAMIPISKVMIPNASTHPQCLPTQATTSAGSPRMPSAIVPRYCRAHARIPPLRSRLAARLAGGAVPARPCARAR
jgi:hypothetical protein